MEITERIPNFIDVGDRELKTFTTPNELIESDFLKIWVLNVEATSISIENMLPYKDSDLQDYEIVLFSNERRYHIAKVYFEKTNELEELELELSKIEFN